MSMETASFMLKLQKEKTAKALAEVEKLKAKIVELENKLSAIK
jgi:hypothetical protein